MSALAFRSVAPAPVIDLDIVTFVLDVRGRTAHSLDKRVQNSIIEGELERTTDGASTLRVTLHDPARTLLRSGLFAHTIDVRLDRFWFRLAQVSKQDDQLTLTFEDRDVARLRAIRGPRKATSGHGKVKPKVETASRATVTRAEFALSLVRELHPAPSFVCPQLHKKQAVAASTTTADTSAPPSPSKDGTYNSAQLQSLWIQAGGPRAVAPTMAAIALAESSGRAGAVGGPNSNGTYDYGCWRINSVHGYPKAKLLAADQSFNAQCAVTIYKAQGLRAWSTYSSGAYRKYLRNGSVPGVSDTRATRRTLPYQFRRGAVNGHPEDSWTCLQRLAQEVNWRCFCNEGRIYFVADDDLLALSTPVTVSEQTPGVAAIDFDLDNGKVSNEATITARASRWAADPGSTVQLHDLGPADGIWIVHDVRRSLYDADATITLRKRGKPLKEPAADTEQVPDPRTRDGITLGKLNAASGGSGEADNPATNAVEQAYAAAISIHNHHYPYVWGGGHARAGVPDRGTGRDPGVGFDCSGSVCAVLAAGGLGLRPGGPAPTSGPLMSWGAAGPGRYLTVYTNLTHAFIVFHTTKGNQHFGTGQWGKGWGGPGFNPNMHPTSGFVARHWPET